MRACVREEEWVVSFAFTLRESGECVSGSDGDGG